MSYSYLQWKDSAFSAGEIQEPGLAERIKALVGSGSVLDLGCGNGRFCSVFNPETYLGVDISPTSIATAKEIHPRYRFEVQDLVTWDLPKVDYIFTWTVLEHINPEFLPELAKKMQQSAHTLLLGEPQADGNEWASHCFPHDYEQFFTILAKHQISNNFYLLEAKGGSYGRDNG